MTFQNYLEKAKVSKDIIKEIMNVTYQKDENEKQDAVNYYAAIMKKCDELLDFDTIANVMYHRACCKSGFRLNNARQLAKEHGDKPLEEKLILLGKLKYMGKPYLNEDGDIVTGYSAGTGSNEKYVCSCWRFGGLSPSEGKMPVSYCLCCAGHFRFHYEKALGLKLRVKAVALSSFQNNKTPCSFVFEILGETKKAKRSV